MRRIFFLGIISIVITSVIIPIQVIAQSIISPVLPDISGSNPISFPKVESSVVIPIEIPLSAIQSKVNKVFPEIFSGSKNDPVSGPLKDDVMTWNANRQPINITGERQNIRMDSAISGVVKLKGTVKLLGGTVGKLWNRVTKNATNIPLTTHADLSASVHFMATPEITKTWTIKPNLSGSIRVTKAEVPIGGEVGKILGHPEISFRSDIQPIFDQKVEKYLAEYNAKIEKDPIMKIKINEQWEKMFLVEQLHENPNIWFTFSPNKIIGQQFHIQNKHLYTGLGIQGNTTLILSQEKPENAPKPLPDFELIDHVPNKFTILLLGTTTFPELNAAIRDTIIGKEQKLDDDSTIKIYQADISSAENHMIIKCKFESSSSSWFKTAKGDLFITAVPVLDRDKKILYFDDLEYDINTKDILKKSAEWLLRPVFLKSLKDKMVIKTDEIEKDIRNQVINQVRDISAKLPEGIILDIKVDDLLFKQLGFSSEALFFIISQEGTVNVHISNLDF